MKEYKIHLLIYSLSFQTKNIFRITKNYALAMYSKYDIII